MADTKFTVRKAAELAGISRQTLFRQIREGKISATQDRSGAMQVDLSELIRVFGELQPESATAGSMRQSSKTAPDTGGTGFYHAELLRLQAELSVKAAQLELAQERITELKERELELKERERQQLAEKHRFLEVIERQTLLLAAPKPKPTPARHPPAAPAPAKKAAPKPTPAKKVSTTVQPGRSLPIVIKAGAAKAKPKPAAKTAPKSKPAATKTTAKTSTRSKAKAPRR